MLQNAYFLAKIGADKTENEQRFAEILPKFCRSAVVSPTVMGPGCPVARADAGARGDADEPVRRVPGQGPRGVRWGVIKSTYVMRSTCTIRQICINI